MNMRVRVGDVIEPAALCSTWPIVNFSTVGELNHHNNNIIIIIQLWTQDLKSSYNNCRMHELMFQAGVKGMSKRSELIPCIL